MKLCKHCKKYNICDIGKHLYGSNSSYAEKCKDFQQKQMTNFEHIKAMNITEMAAFIGFFNQEEDICSLSNKNTDEDYCRCHNCAECAKKYLESEAAE